MASAIFVGAATIAVLLYSSQLAKIIAWATVGTYIVYQMVVVGAIYARRKGWPKEKAHFNLGRWGWPVNLIALAFGVFMIIDLSWPWTTGSFFDRYLVPISAGCVLGAGIIVYFIQRARGVDLSGTIHEIGESPTDADAAFAMAAGEAGKVLSGGLGVSEMTGSDRPDGPGSYTT